MANVIIYGTGSCPFCVRARNLLTKKGIAFTEHRVDEDPSLRPEMEKLSGRTSVPQIFIDDRHVGGVGERSGRDIDGERDELVGGR